MYAEHFGFSKLPFSATPDPQVFFNNSVYREAFAKLQHGVLAKKGFVVITGEVGTGKTTLLRKLLHSLGPTVHSVFIFNTQVSFVELLRLILDDLNLARENDDKLTMIEILNRYLIERLRQGHIVALLIDEAQNLCDDALEGLRLLSNLETDTEKLLQIVLMGQPELEVKLDHPKLRQLKQRITIQCRLAPLKKQEVGAYIEFRLNAAGYRGQSPFQRASLETIAFYSRRIPRLVNIICDNALLAAFAASKAKVSAQMVEEVARDLQIGPPRPIEAGHPVNHKMPDNPVKSRREEERLPEFENVLAGAENEHRPELQRKRSLTGFGVGVFLGAVFLGGIAVSYSQQNKLYLSDLAVSWGDFSRGGKDYLSDWTVKVKDFVERTEEYIADSALKAEDLSIQGKNYLGAKAGDFYRQNADYLTGLVQTAEDLSRQGKNAFSRLGEKAGNFYRRSKDDLAGLAARTGEAVRLRWKSLNQVKPITKTSEDNSSKVRLADSNDVNPSKRTEPLFGHPPTVAEKPPSISQELKEQDNKGPLPAAKKPAETQMAKNTGPPTESRAISDSSEAQQADSHQLASLKPEPASLEPPNEGQAPYLGNFEVVENSFVRDKPESDAEIITTLKPGTSVRVESKTGKYFRVRSMNDPGVRGYVHEEDAFFKRIK